MRYVFRLPDVGEGIAQADIVEYLVKPRDTVKADQPVVRIETDKAVVELPSPVSGTVVEMPFKPGDSVSVGDPLLIIETEKLVAAPRPEPELMEAKPPPRREAQMQGIAERAQYEAPKSTEKILATPHTRRLARELSVDISTVKATGSHGRVTDDDIRRAASEATLPPPKAPTAAAVQAPATAGFDFEKYGPTRRIALKGVRKRIAEVMARSVSTIPHVSHFDRADVTELLQVLEQERFLAQERGIKLTVLAFLAKAAAAGLKQYPILNSSLDEETGELVIKEYIHIGIATDTEAGLMVPVIRDVDKKSIMTIAAETQDLSRKARDRTIDLESLRGGSFTITNVGALGGLWATPIILHPQVAILASMRAQPMPVVRDNEVVVRTIMPLTVSFDHRVLDGATAARFTDYVAALLGDPMRLLMEMT
jgi:pyruvate/2-oxoglutarate dehydrogenase complex dihydrolipoamide acyltransferase (E2) component